MCVTLNYKKFPPETLVITFFLKSDKKNNRFRNMKGKIRTKNLNTTEQVFNYITNRCLIFF